MELILTHDGHEWRADGGGWRLHATTLAGLDQQLARRLEECGEFRQWERIRVAMRFDMDGLPRWLHQYSHHYFNRVVTLSRPETGVFGTSPGETP